MANQSIPPVHQCLIWMIILRTEIPECPVMPDMSKYVLKSSIPPCPVCPSCPPCHHVLVAAEVEVAVEAEAEAEAGEDGRKHPRYHSNSNCCKPPPPCPPCPRPRCPKVKCEKIIYQWNPDKKCFSKQQIENMISKAKHACQKSKKCCQKNPGKKGCDSNKDEPESEDGGGGGGGSSGGNPHPYNAGGGWMYSWN